MRAYEPPPDREDSGGVLVCPPNPEAPDISAQYALSVGATDATLRAEINPRRWGDATYYVQYGTAACVEGGGWDAPCVSEQPAPPGAELGAGAVDFAVKAAVSLPGLAADTSYRFRFVAQSSGGGPVSGVGGKVGEEGADGAFRTFPPPPPLFAGCANQQFRTATSSAHLPSCRAYEMVSPVDKAGADINARQDTQSGRDLALDQAAAVVPPEGRGLSYTSRQAFGDAVAAPEMNQYLANRSPAGWISHSLFPPQHGSDAEGPPMFKAFSEDLGVSWMWREAEPPLDPCAPAGFPNFYRRDNTTETYEALSCEPLTAPFRTELQGTSDDSSHAVFRSRSALTPDANELAPEKDESEQPFQVYEWEEEGLRLVSVLPSGAACTKGSSAGSASGSFNSGRWHLLATAVSADGERVYWSCEGRLYLRSGGSGPSAPVSELVSPNPAQFWAAASDGSEALFTVGALATGDATLYRYDAIAKAATPIASSVSGLVGQSTSLSRVYLISDADLDGAGEGEAGKHNLYLLEAGDFIFVAALSDLDAGATTDAPSPGHGMPIRHNARVTPDGTHAAFMSNSKALAEEVAGLDNTDANSGEADAEVYIYDAESDELLCPSCNRSGASPQGRDIGVELHPYWTAAKIPTWVYSLYAPRALSDDGSRLFFESFEALVLRDTNGRQDVYEWQDGTSQEDCESRGAELFVANTSGAGGCLSLISSGKDESDSDFTDASADGSDVFLQDLREPGRAGSRPARHLRRAYRWRLSAAARAAAGMRRGQLPAAGDGTGSADAGLERLPGRGSHRGRLRRVGQARQTPAGRGPPPAQGGKAGPVPRPIQVPAPPGRRQGQTSQGPAPPGQALPKPSRRIAMTRLEQIAALAAIAATAVLLAATPALAAAPGECVVSPPSFDFCEAQVAFSKGGAQFSQAGGHPDAFTTDLAFNTEIDPKTGNELPIGQAKDLVVDVPPGLILFPTATPRCSAADFLTDNGGIPACPDAAAIGLTQVTIGNEAPNPFAELPVYNLAPVPGKLFRFGFLVAGIRVTVDAAIRPTPPYNGYASIPNITQQENYYASSTTLWGFPASPLHDEDRGNCAREAPGVKCPASLPERALITMPRSCGGPLSFLFQARPWTDPGTWASAEDEIPGLLGCEKIGFGPRVSAQPSSALAESASGLDFAIEIDDPALTGTGEVADSDVRKAVVTLPEGMTANPSVAAGLETCSPARYEAEKLDSTPGQGCPQASKLGTVEVKTPLLEGEVVRGEVFLATPDDPSTAAVENPFDSLLALYMVIREPRLGLLVKLPGKVEPHAGAGKEGAGPGAGRLITTFGEPGHELPQLPFSDFHFRFHEGAGSPLVTPPACGTYEVRATFTPWANPGSPYSTSASFDIERGVGGGPCPPPGRPPFEPGFEAGSLNNHAGSYTPFFMRLTRRDGDQDMTRFDASCRQG